MYFLTGYVMPCPPDFSVVGNLCIYLNATLANLYQHDSACKSRYGHLVKIDSEMKHFMLTAYIAGKEIIKFLYL